MRSLTAAGSSRSATQKTQPTRRPFNSAIMAASRRGSCATGVVGDDPRDERLEVGVPAELGVVDLPAGLDDPAQVARPPSGRIA